jgi:GNAT superfamily N-acetyltransferase
MAGAIISGAPLATYTITHESFRLVYPAIEHILRTHYGEMAARLNASGVHVAAYNPRLDKYFEAADAGWLKTYVARCDGIPVGYSTIYVTNDMHNGEVIASEDAIYVLKPHRKSIGKKLVKHVLDDLRGQNVKRLSVSATTELRVIPLFRRMGFKEVAMKMAYVF